MPATVAGMFTTNQVCAAPVKVCAERVKRGTAQAIVVNSGNANVCTGRQGLKRCEGHDGIRGELLHMPPEQVLVGSTGRIGVTMPMARAPASRPPRKPRQRRPCADESAEAIATSDTKSKRVAVEFKLGGKTVRIGGICKGGNDPTWHERPPDPARCRAARLHATMLCFITTDDAAIEAKTLKPLAGSGGE